MENDTNVRRFSAALAFTFLFGSILFFGWAAWKLRRSKAEPIIKKEINKKYGALVEGVREDSKVGVYFILLVVFRRTIIALFLVFIHDNG